MANPISNASNAYLNTVKQLQGGDNAAGSSGAGAIDAVSGAPSFGDVLKQSLSSAIDAQHNSEKVSAQALVGKADMTDVLQAVNNAEMALNTVLAVRDRVVQAYDQIMRTSI
ncbi:MAG: flagellar hook-basal body complex protein FliE [Micavibrio sp.]|nr:flagellar hook-basal body complex protein FliE [Micavibrio sp.]